MNSSFDPFIYGKDETENIVSIEMGDNFATIITETENGIKMEDRMASHWILFAADYTGDCVALDGELHYKFAKAYRTAYEKRKVINEAKVKRWDYYVIHNQKEMYMVRNGSTYYKGMDPIDVSILSFDIETTGLSPKTSQVLMISNTFRKGDHVERKLFSYEDFGSEQEMIDEWCKYVSEVDPSLLLGHNIYGFDLPFLNTRSKDGLQIGRNESKAFFSTFTSQFRKDGSQSYDFNKCLVWGREIVDTFHLAIKYDTARRYPSYSLKPLIKFEGLEKADRQHWDFADISPMKIHQEFKAGNTELWQKFKTYAEHDADDSLALFDLMASAYFYYTQSIPKPFQEIISGATGSQVNAFMVRSYLSYGHSIPKANKTEHYVGGISFGNPGYYEKCYKVDVASLYPSIIRQYEVYDEDKDPKRYFLRMVSVFTDQRLQHKKLAKDTGDRKYADREQAEKILINSAYGFMGAPMLNFNSPSSAALVTKHGREILEKGIEYCEKKAFGIVNADTDSFMFHSRRPFSFDNFIVGLNEQFPDMISWEDDGRYSKVLIVKAKNYVLVEQDTDKTTIKGSALKATMKEPALRKFITEAIGFLIGDDIDGLRDCYQNYATTINDIDADTISQWCSKKTITKSVLKPNRTQEERIKAAYQTARKTVNEGDKIHVFFKTKTELALTEMFDGEYCKSTILKKLFKTIQIFESVIDISLFPNYALKRNQEAYEEITAVRGNSSSNNKGTYEAAGSLSAAKR